jgi:hypothetical protein
MFVWAGTPRDETAYKTARRLRRDHGLSFKRIARELEISPATAHQWTRDIELTEAQEKRLRRGPSGPASPAAVAARAATWRRKCRARRETYQREGRQRARLRDVLHMAGCMLYWAEGSKSRNTVKLANSDPDLVAFFCRFLREALDVQEADIRFALNVYLGNGLALEQIEEHWLDTLQLPRSCIRKHTINSKPTSSSGRKRNKLPYGVATVRVQSTQIVQHIYGAIQEYAGFENPAWLDC